MHRKIRKNKSAWAAIRNTMNWVTETTFISHSFGGWEVQDQSPSRFGSW